MKVRISTVGRSISVDMAEDRAGYIFNNLVLHLLGITEEQEQKKIGVEKENIIIEESALECGTPLMYEKSSGDREKLNCQEEKGIFRYRGFMYLKCPNCGVIKGFCSKEELESYHCKSCGTDTLFSSELKPLYLSCQCGERFKYMTNMDVGMFDVDCINCGNPVAVGWNERKKIYETIRSW